MDEDKIPKAENNAPLSNQSRMGNIENQINTIHNILWAAVIVMLFMVGNMLMDSWNNKSASMQNLYLQMNEQNNQLLQINNKLGKK